MKRCKLITNTLNNICTTNICVCNVEIYNYEAASKIQQIVNEGR